MEYKKDPHKDGNMSNFSLSKRAKHTGAMLAIIAPKDIVKKNA